MRTRRPRRRAPTTIPGLLTALARAGADLAEQHKTLITRHAVLVADEAWRRGWQAGIDTHDTSRRPRQETSR